jgi:hypothetical protein
MQAEDRSGKSTDGLPQNIGLLQTDKDILSELKNDHMSKYLEQNNTWFCHVDRMLREGLELDGARTYVHTYWMRHGC